MRTILASAIIAMLTTGTAVAQQQDQARAQAVAEFADDLAELQQEFPSYEQHLALDMAERAGFWERAVEGAQDMRDRWKDNPYVEVEGFSISLGLSIGIDVDFRFKD